MASDNSVEAPVYRYFTADLMSNKILMEIPFSDVTWERALKAGGAFSGQIPVIPATTSLDLYNTTMPGQTALYVVRDGVCVWGGIIWSRAYNVKNNVLEVSGNEFTSYFHHRNIWKTVNYQFSATVRVGSGLLQGVLDYDKTSGFTSGSSVNVEFYEPENFRYNGYYKIINSPPPTENTFTTKAGASASLVRATSFSTAVLFETDGPHGFSTGDRVITTIDPTTADKIVVDSFSGPAIVTVPDGSGSNYYIIPSIKGNTPLQTDIERAKTFARVDIKGDAVRSLPDGEYSQVTVTVRTDTYDYIRGLVANVFEDFVGIDFANDYLTPGIESALPVTRTRLSQGFATITTDGDHQLSVGQSVKVRDVSSIYDGDFEVVETPSNNVFVYNKGGERGTGLVAPKSVRITARTVGNNVATLKTEFSHGFVVGNQVEILPGQDVDGLASYIAGTHTITAVPSLDSFSYEVNTPVASPLTYLSNPVVQTSEGEDGIYSVVSRSFSGSSATIRTTYPTNLKVGDNFGVYNLNVTVPIVERAIDGPNGRLIIKTAVPHQFQVGDSVTISGIKDYAVPSRLEITGTAGRIIKRRNLLLNPRYRSTAGVTQFGTTDSTFSADTNGMTMKYSSTAAPTSRNRNGFYMQGPLATASSLYTNLPVITNVRTNYTLTAWVLTTGNVYASLFVNGGTNTYVPDPASVTASNGTWTQQTLSFTTAGNGSMPTVMVINDRAFAAGSNNSISIRDVQLEQVVSLYDSTPYFYSGTATSGIYQYGTETYLGSTVQTEYTTGIPSATVTFTTSPAHNFATGTAVTMTDLIDTYIPTGRTLSGNNVTINTSTAHNLSIGSQVTLSNIVDNYSISSYRIENGVATINSSVAHSFSVNDNVTIAGITETARVVTKEIQHGIVTLTFADNHNIQLSQEIVVSGVGAPFDSVSSQSTIVLSTSSTRLSYQLLDKNGNDLPNVDAKPTKATGTVSSANSVLNGNYVAIAVPGTNSVQVGLEANDTPLRAVSNSTLSGDSPVNGIYLVTAVPSFFSFSYTKVYKNLAYQAITLPANSTVPAPSVESVSTLNGSYTLTAVSRYTFSYRTAVQSAIAPKAVSVGGAYTNSYYRGNRTIISVPNSTTMVFGVAESVSSLETAVNLSAYVSNTQLFNSGNSTVLAINDTKDVITYKTVSSATAPKAHGPIQEAAVAGYGLATVTPRAQIGTFGSFPGNADIDVQFSTRKYSGKNLPPIAYRGHELTNVGSALDAYSGSVDGFEYRIDCAYDAANDRFTRTFVLIPIDFPNPPPPGEASPPSRFGADKLVFEYPGNISDVKLDESAENAATRFFAVGKSGLGGEAADPFSAASAEDLLNAKSARKWPILDQTESLSDISDETVLYGYAKQFLAEARPPEGEFTVTVNGSLQPEVPNYYPGDWCSIIVNDPFLKERLKSSMEPRDTVIVRKIDSYKVKVPDGTTFPETVSLNLVTEWDVDKRDNSA